MEAINASALDQKLDARGLLEVGKRWEWHAVKHNNITGWEYPIYNPFTGEVIATRFKSAEKGSKQKYGWLPSKPSNPLAEWYTMPSAIEAIAQSGGVAYLANGEPSLLAYHAAQVYNAFATTLSEIAVPKNLIGYLRDLGVNRLLYPIDNDEAGHKSAVNWRDALRGSGIDFEAFTWGKDAPAKADANDIWIQVGFNAEAFQSRLKSLEALVLPEPIAPISHIQVVNFEHTPQGLIDTLASRLGVQRFRANGWSVKNVSSPFRDDKEPSAGFNRISGVLHDFGTEESYSPSELAEHFGIDTKPFYPSGYIQKNSIDTKVSKPKKPRRQAPISITVDIDSEIDESIPEPLLYPAAYFSWIDQRDIPVSWLSSILNLSDGRSSVPAVVIKLHDAFRKGKLNAAGFTIKEVVDTLSLPRKSVTAAIETLFEWGFVSILETIINTMYTPHATEHKSPINGRPSKIYRVNTDSKMTALLLAEMMDYCITEAIGRKTLVPASHTMFSDMLAQGLEYSEAKKWAARTEGAAKYTKFKLDAELELWAKSLLRDDCQKSYKLDPDSIESSRDVRVQLLKAYLSEFEGGGVQISNERLAWLLGCNESNLKAIYEDAIVFSERRFGEYEPDIETIRNKTYDDLINEAGREESGLPIAMLIKRINTNKWTGYQFGEAAMFDLFKRERGNIARMKIRVEQPSFVRLGRLKSGYFSRIQGYKVILAYMLQCVVRLVASEDATEIIEAEQDAVAEIKATLPKATAKPRAKTTMERNWRSHNYEFLREQLRIEAHIFTRDGLLPEELGLVDAARYLNVNALVKPIRTVTSYFLQDDELSTLIGTLEILGGERRQGEHARPRKDEIAVLPTVSQSPIEFKTPDNKVDALVIAMYEKDLEKRKPIVNRFAKGAA